MSPSWVAILSNCVMGPALGKLNQCGVCFRANFPKSTISSILTSSNLITPRSYSTRSMLTEIGKLEEKQPVDNLYAAGQPFLHRIFGYRGVISFSWMARINDHDLKNQFSDEIKNIGLESQKTCDPHAATTAQMNGQSQPRDIESSSKLNQQSTRFHPYYQVLIDFRDIPYVKSRIETEAIFYLRNPTSSQSVLWIEGLDYVAHEDIIPYTSHEETPIANELYRGIFKENQNTNDDSKFDQDSLEIWRNKHPWIDLSQVYRETTENVRVTVIPFYLGHRIYADTSFYWWRYCVRLENFSDTNVKLHERYLKIFSRTNMVQTIKGRGVAGVEPLLSKGKPAFQYSSQLNLPDESGHMWGIFKMQRDDGHTFECKIPSFSLESSVNMTTPPTSKRSRDDSID